MIETSFVEQYKQFSKLSTDAPEQYAEVLSVQILGFAMGREPVHLIQPEAIYHNIFAVLVGESTLTRKSTSQGFANACIPYEHTMPTETSPEKFVALLAEKSNRIQFQGEFSKLLKGINKGGYMSAMSEIQNDIHGCPEYFVRALMGAEHVVNDAYFSTVSTLTPQMLKKYLDDELVEGGFLARYILVYGEPCNRPRKRLNAATLSLKEQLKSYIEYMFSLDRSGVTFECTDAALDKYNELEQHAMSQYGLIRPFVGRYMNYMLSIADILLVSDALGHVAENAAYGNYTTLSGMLQYFCSNNDIDMQNTSFAISEQYIERAWDILKPSLDYASTLVDYVLLDKPVAKVIEFLSKQPDNIAARTALSRGTRLSKRRLDAAIETLRDRGQLLMNTEVVKRTKRGIIHKYTYKLNV